MAASPLRDGLCVQCERSLRAHYNRVGRHRGCAYARRQEAPLKPTPAPATEPVRRFEIVQRETQVPHEEALR